MVPGSDNGDINIGGKRGAPYMYLYVDRSEESNKPGYIDLDVCYDEEIYNQMLERGWDLVSGDLNEGAGSENVYLIA